MAVSSCGSGDTGSLYDVVADTSEDGPAEQTSQRELKQVVLDRLKELPELAQGSRAFYGEDFALLERDLRSIAHYRIRAFGQSFPHSHLRLVQSSP